jgi:hypothetical protein
MATNTDNGPQKLTPCWEGHACMRTCAVRGRLGLKVWFSRAVQIQYRCDATGTPSFSATMALNSEKRMFFFT